MLNSRVVLIVAATLMGSVASASTLTLGSTVNLELANGIAEFAPSDPNTLSQTTAAIRVISTPTLLDAASIVPDPRFPTADYSIEVLTDRLIIYESFGDGFFAGQQLIVSGLSLEPGLRISGLTFSSLDSPTRTDTPSLVGGSLDQTGFTIDLGGFDLLGVPSGLDEITVSFVTETVQPIPLPAAAWFLVAGMGALGVVARRRPS